MANEFPQFGCIMSSCRESVIYMGDQASLLASEPFELAAYMSELPPMCYPLIKMLGTVL